MHKFLGSVSNTGYSSFLRNWIITYIHLCMHLWGEREATHHSAQVEVRGHIQEMVLSFHSMGPRVQLRFSGLAERAFTH